MPLDEKAKAEIMAIFKNDPLRGISLTNMYSDEAKLCAICTSIWDETLKKEIKIGWIPTKAYNANLDIIVKWENTKDEIEYLSQEVKDHKETIVDYSDMVNKIETDPFYARAYASRKAWYVEHLKIESDELKDLELKLKEIKREFPELKKHIVELMNFNYLRENKYI